MHACAVNSTRPYRSVTRDERAHATREAILAAIAEQLGRTDPTTVSIPTAAERAGVAVRTVYHHFPDPAARLAAVAAWIDDGLGPLPPIAGAADLPDHIRRVHARGARRLDAVRALARAAPAEDERSRRRRARHLEIAALLTGIGAPAGPTTSATAVVAMLASPEAIVALVDVHGLAADEAAESLALATAAIVADLRSQRSA